MNDDEKMLYYTDVFSSFTNNVVSRKIAYDAVTELIPLYWRDLGTSGEYLTESSELRAAVDTYNKFDYNKLIEVYSSENLKKLTALCDKLAALDRVPATFDERRGLLAEIDAFILENDGFITVNDEYRAYITVINRIRNEVSAEELVNKFITAVDSFYSATGYVYVEKAYNNMTELYSSGLDFTLAENESFVSF